MILGDVFERFAQDSPLTVMAQGVHGERPQPRDRRPTASRTSPRRQYTRKLLFSSVVDLMSLGRLPHPSPPSTPPIRPTPRLSRSRSRPSTTRSTASEPAISAALVSTTARTTGSRSSTPWAAPGPRSCRAIASRSSTATISPGPSTASRNCGRSGAGALPGQALVVLDPRRMLAIDVVLCEDGHAQERSLLDQSLGDSSAPKDLWIEDRNFCTTNFLFGIAPREAFFVIRQHASTLHWEFAGKRRAVRPDRDRQGVRADDPGHQRRRARS